MVELQERTNGTGRKPKIPPVWHMADSCMVTVGRVMDGDTIIDEGTAYPVHEGERVAILPAASVQESIILGQISREATADRNTGELFERLCQMLSHRVIEWDWTDLQWEPLPQPYGNADAIAMLTNEEVLWLIGVAMGQESRDERKNGSGA